MTYEETAILFLLKGSPSVYLARREIARKALKRAAFEENPHWADAPLTSLLDLDLVEQNDSGHFRMKSHED